MYIISFAWTTDALLTGKKTVTRRVWKRCNLKTGDLVQAWDKSPRFKGKRIAILKIISVRQEYLMCGMTDEEEKKEGGLWGNAEEYVNAFVKAYKGMSRVDKIWRIEFEIIKKEQIK